MLTEGELLRFWPKVDVREVDECWPWMGARRGHGYGDFWREHGPSQQAHRVAWEAMHGEIPEGLWVLHTCDNKLCVNPLHLFLGTHRDNDADRDRKGRQARGESHGMAKLTQAHVRHIRGLLSAGESQAAAGRRFGVSRSAVQHIADRSTWAWLEEA